MGGPCISQTMWFALTLLSLSARLVLAWDCPWFSKEYCCENGALGCYSSSPLPCCFDDHDVKYLVFTRSNRNVGERIYLHAAIPEVFVSRQRTVFVIHGYQADGDADGSMFLQMKDALLTKGAVNVVVVDWPSDRYIYTWSASETQTVGALTGLVMDKLVGAGSRPDSIWCVGHSLGAHVCGFAGRWTTHKIGRVTGLDPAGLWFYENVGLNRDSGQFVDVIHTDTKGTMTGDFVFLGTKRPLGHMDFYVNGLEEQPHCYDRRRRALFDTLSCSHSRANEYFLETIKNEECFLSTIQCPSVNSLETVSSSCTPCTAGAGVCAKMGYGATRTGGGIYYVQASDTPTHCTPAY